MLNIKTENKHNINLKGKLKGHVRTICPFCSHDRKKENQKLPCLYVDLDVDKPYYFCHNCSKTGLLHEYGRIESELQDTEYKLNNIKTTLPQPVYDYFLNKRGISKETVDKKNIQYVEKLYFIGAGGERGAIGFPYYKYGSVVNFKYRSAKKDFMMQKGCEKPFYNLDAIRFVDCAYIVEGEFDVLSMEECGITNSVSPPNGASDKGMKWLDESFEVYFKDKKKIILAGDNDDVGRELHERLAARLGKHKCFVVDWQDCKDANEYLVRHGKEKLLEQINKATPYPVDGLFTLDISVSDRLIAEHTHGVQKGEYCHILSLKEHFSWMKKDINIFAGYNNHGKSEFFYYASMLMAVHSGWKTVIAALEEKTADRFYRKLIEVFVGKRIDPENALRGNQMTQQELKDAIEFVREHFFFVKPNGSWTIDKVLEVMADCSAMYGANIVCIDPYNRLLKPTSHLRDDELIIDALNKCDVFAKDTNTSFNVITHVNKPGITKDGVVSRPNRFQLLGGQATANAADNVLFVHNPQDPIDRTYSGRFIIVDKVRDRDLIGIPGETELDFSYRKRRFLDIIDGDKKDPLVGYGEHIQRTSVTVKSENWETDEVPF